MISEIEPISWAIAFAMSHEVIIPESIPFSSVIGKWLMLFSINILEASVIDRNNFV